MINRVADFLREYNLQEKTVVLGFSGGFDSMCLLDILSKIRELPEFFDLNIIAAHFNHNWRGEEALKEQEVCRLFAASRGCEFYTKTAPVGLKKSENDARIARYEFFEETLENYDADAVFTAHNKDDNAETVLYRVIKGTGLIGLKGISRKRDYFYRPLLNIPRSEIIKYCENNNLEPNNDSSNYNTQYKRNYIRLNILPMLEKINPSVKDSLNSLARIATNENAIIEEYLATIKPLVFVEDKIIASVYKKLSKPVKLRLLHEFINNLNLDYDYKKILEFYDFIETNIEKRNGSTISLTTAKWLYVDEKIIEVIPPQTKTKQQAFELIIDSEGEYQFGEKKIFI